MQVAESIVRVCNARIDGTGKRMLRTLINGFSRRRNRLGEIGAGAQVGLFRSIPRGSRLGRYCYIGPDFYCESPISVGDLTMISSNVRVVGNDHGTDRIDMPIRLDFRWQHSVTVFESDVWIGAGVLIRAGVTIGRGSVVAAGSVVVKNVEPYVVVGGNPAKVIRPRFTLQEISTYETMLYEKSVARSK